MEILWSLGHRKTKAVEKNIYANQLASRVVESLKNGGQIEDWVVWCVGWKKWEDLSSVEELMNEIMLLKKLSASDEDSQDAQPPSLGDSFDAPKAPAASPLSSSQTTNSHSAHSQAAEAQTNSEPNPKPARSDDDINWAEKRQHKRVEARFRCIIKSSSVTFRTFTRDVSLGGVALEDPIPNELLGNECQIYITGMNNKKNLKFKIKVTPRPGARFFSFENTDQAFMDELNSWLEQYLHDEKEKKLAS